ncbi:Hypothetical predicted protein [Lecanosticta acicola]|uniref:Uncharacterized protein n=1 Tax=Lecanosticta acicola TaxID=111012 RepID=A0AAI8YUX4_9PEZI|nr:Hypothetical predicted protein [Lecanosticta acicola]
MLFYLLLAGFVVSVLAAPNANLDPAVTPAPGLQIRQDEIGGGIAGTAGGAQGTAGGALNGPTGAAEGCLGGGYESNGITECAPVATAPAQTATASQAAGGNASGTIGPASAFLDSDGLCGGAAVGSSGFTTCLVPTSSA